MREGLLKARFLRVKSTESQKCPESSDHSGKAWTSESRDLNDSRCSTPTPSGTLDSNRTSEDEDGNTTEELVGNICLNIGGTPFIFRKSTLANRPGTRLSRLVNVLSLESDEERFTIIRDIVDDYFKETDEYYFDRSPYLFEPIATYYRTGLLHKPEQSCSVIFKSELKYWGIDSKYMMNCCDAARLLKHLAEAYKNKKSQRRNEGEEEEQATPEKMYKFWANFRYELWTGLEFPWKTKVSLVYAVLSLICIILSLSIMVMESMPTLRFEHCLNIPELAKYNNVSDNETATFQELHVRKDGQEAGERNQLIEDLLNHCPAAQITLAFHLIGILCMTVFTIDYILRVFSAPKTLRFIISPLGLVDLLSMLPFYMELIFSTGLHGSPTLASIYRDTSGVVISIRAIRFLRLFRVIMVFKLARFSSGLRLMALVMRYSYSALVLILLYGAMYVIIFGTVLHFVEGDEKGSKFNSIPAGCWWAVVTLTTLGYGDMYPETWQGKCIGAIATIISILILAFPVSIIVDNMKKAFSQLGAERERKQKSLKKTKSVTSPWQSLRSFAFLKGWKSVIIPDSRTVRSQQSTDTQSSVTHVTSLPEVFTIRSQRAVSEESSAVDLPTPDYESNIADQLEALTSELANCDKDVDQVTLTLKLPRSERRWVELSPAEVRRKSTMTGAKVAPSGVRKSSWAGQDKLNVTPEDSPSAPKRRLSTLGAKRTTGWINPVVPKFELDVLHEELESRSSNEAPKTYGETGKTTGNGYIAANKAET